MNIRSHPRRGFTLLEVLLAMAILTLVISAIYATWRLILGAMKTSQAVAADVQRSRIAMRCLEQSLTYATMRAPNGGVDYYSFVAENGSDAMLSFVSDLPGDFPRSGRFGEFHVRRLEYSIQSGKEGGRELVLRQAPLLMDFDEDEQEYPLVLMKNVRKMEMEFWDLRQQDWTDEWGETNQMPKLIRITITTHNPRSAFDRGEEYVRVISPACEAAPSTPAAQPNRRGLGLPPIRPR